MLSQTNCRNVCSILNHLIDCYSCQISDDSQDGAIMIMGETLSIERQWSWGNKSLSLKATIFTPDGILTNHDRNTFGFA